jgi:hypothetical protein
MEGTTGTRWRQTPVLPEKSSPVLGGRGSIMCAEMDQWAIRFGADYQPSGTAYVFPTARASGRVIVREPEDPLTLLPRPGRSSANPKADSPLLPRPG